MIVDINCLVDADSLVGATSSLVPSSSDNELLNYNWIYIYEFKRVKIYFIFLFINRREIMGLNVENITQYLV